MAEVSGEHPVVLFDGVCNVCNRAVNFIIDRDPEGTFRFASLQSEAGRTIVQGFGRTIPEGIPRPSSSSIARVFTSNQAQCCASRVTCAAHGPCSRRLLVVPRPLRDVLYRWAAARRYKWFGKSDTCRVPTQELRARFLE